MGLGFDIFKARVGYDLAGGLMDSLSSAIEKNAAETAAKAKVAKEAQNRRDMLKTLVFMTGNNTALGRTEKKFIAELLSRMYDEDISLFSIEDKIDDAYEKIQNEGPRKFFNGISAIKSDREQIVLIYTCILILYTDLANSQNILPAHAYNVALIKYFFGVTRSELVKCYSAVANFYEKDMDDIADLFESLTSEEAIKAIEEANPTFAFEEEKEAEPEVQPQEEESETCENPRDEITSLYYQAIKEAGSEADNFKAHVLLADTSPEQLMKIVNLYARDCVGEDAILIFDNTWTKNFKNGFLLTNKNIYIGSSGKLLAKIPLDDIKFLDAPQKSNKLVINTTDIDCLQIFQEGTTSLANYLLKIIPLAMEIEVNVTNQNNKEEKQ